MALPPPGYVPRKVAKEFLAQFEPPPPPKYPNIPSVIPLDKWHVTFPYLVEQSVQEPPPPPPPTQKIRHKWSNFFKKNPEERGEENGEKHDEPPGPKLRYKRSGFFKKMPEANLQEYDGEDGDGEEGDSRDDDVKSEYSSNYDINEWEYYEGYSYEAEAESAAYKRLAEEKSGSLHNFHQGIFDLNSVSFDLVTFTLDSSTFAFANKVLPCSDSPVQVKTHCHKLMNVSYAKIKMAIPFVNDVVSLDDGTPTQYYLDVVNHSVENFFLRLPNLQYLLLKIFPPTEDTLESIYYDDICEFIERLPRRIGFDLIYQTDIEDNLFEARATRTFHSLYPAGIRLWEMMKERYPHAAFHEQLKECYILQP